jgi:hypothetical protein
MFGIATVHLRTMLLEGVVLLLTRSLELLRRTATELLKTIYLLRKKRRR